MIKCDECGEEFSYGRKINCCKSIYFGQIFNASKREHKWNNNPDIVNYRTTKKARDQENIEMKHCFILYE